LRAAAEEHAETVLGFGATDGAAMRLDDLTLTDTSSVVRGRFLDEKFLFKVAAPGRHFAMNALAVLAAARVAGADFDVAACDIAHWRPPAGRGTRETIALDPVEDHEIDLIDDAFNANPASMAASLEVLAATRPVDDIGRIARGRRIAVLGDMLELGPDEEKLHAEIADHPAMADITLVHCVGPRMAALWDALPETKRGHKAARAEDLAARAHGLIDAGDVVLVKGSKGSRVSIVVDAFRKLGHPRPTND